MGWSRRSSHLGHEVIGSGTELFKGNEINYCWSERVFTSPSVLRPSSPLDIEHFSAQGRMMPPNEGSAGIS